MTRIGLLGPWSTSDAVDLLLIRHLGVAVARDLDAELVVVVGRGRERFPWPVPAVTIDELLASDLDGILVSGDLATSHDVVGVVPPDVWMAAAGLASAAGLPVAWYGVRLLGDVPHEGMRSVLPAAGETFVVDEASVHRLASRGQLIPHPLSALSRVKVDPPADRRVVHASPLMLALLADLGDAIPGRWLALRPARGDRLVGLPEDAPRCFWSDPSEVLEAFAGAAEVVTDDPAVGAIAISQGSRWQTPDDAIYPPEDAAEDDDARTIGPSDQLLSAAWEATVEQLQRSGRPDASPLRRALMGSFPQPAEDVVAAEEKAVVRAPAKPDVEQVRQVARDAKRRADRWRDDYYELRARGAVKLALRLSGVLGLVQRAGPVGVVRAVVRKFRGRVLRSIPRNTTRRGMSDVTQPPDAPARRASDPDQHAIDRVKASISTSDRTSGPLVSILVLTRDGLAHLRRLLPALDRTHYRSFEVIVVDNGSAEPTRQLLADWQPDVDLHVLRNEVNVTFGAGNNQAAAVASGELLLLMNDDVEPIEPGWLGRLVSTSEGTGAGAIGARLIYPAQVAEDNVGDSAPEALSLQHRGIHFENWGDGMPRARHLDARGDAVEPRVCEVQEVPAATAACLMIPRTTFDAIEGFTAGYNYGLEDVDLCLKIRAGGHRIVVDGATALWHHEFGTQNARGAEDKKRRREHNRQRFAGLWGPRLHREVLRDRIRGEQRWSEMPLHVVITVSRLDERRRHGDWYSAHELGGALESLGWRVTYVERYESRWYDLPRDVDVLVVLLDSYDLAEVPDHLLTVAWVRNWTDRWVERPWFDDFDIVFASSEVSAGIVRERSTHDPVLLPLATDPDRFRPEAAKPDERCDVVFVGSYWGEERPVAHALAALADRYTVRLYGRGWDNVAEVAHLHRGVVAYSRLPSVMASARVVLDDTASPTKPYEAVNTRVFDALASGTMVVSDNPQGIAQRFTTPLPTWTDPAQAVAVVDDLLSNERRCQSIIEQGRAEVVAHHTYRQRAERFRDELLAWVESPRIDVLTGVPDRRVEHRWGDTHFARAFQRQLRRHGLRTRLVRLPEWETIGAATADAVVHLFGRSEYFPRPGQVSLLWNISHPELVTPKLCERYDRVMIASESFADELREAVSVPVHVVHQATDPDRFRPVPDGPPHDLLFVGNSRKVRRRVVDDLLPTDLDLAIYGWGWSEELVDLSYVRAEHVPNHRLGGYYAAAAIVLNDHWDDMRDHAFVSNRLYDALAAGAFVISDGVAGINELFDGGVVTYRDREELHALVASYLIDPWQRERVAARGRAAVLERHTFAHRVGQIIAILHEHEVAATVLGEPLRWPDGGEDGATRGGHDKTRAGLR